MTQASFTIGPDHPSLPGHFPGRAVVPGVVLLDHALAALGVDPAGLPAVKFLRPVLPGETVTVAATMAGERLSVTCSVEGAPVARLTLAPAPPRSA